MNSLTFDTIKIPMYTPKAVKEAMEIKDTYIVIKKNKLIDKLISFAIKHKFIKNYMESVVKVRYVEIKAKDLVSTILQQYDDLTSYGYSPKTLYVGGNQYRDFISGATTFEQIISFNFNNRVRKGEDVYFMGLKVVLVPYFDGILIV